MDLKEALRLMKQDFNRGLEAGDLASLRASLEELELLSLTWEAVQETAIGKEVGRCAKHEDSEIAARAKTIVGTLHRLAKQERPWWVR